MTMDTAPFEVQAVFCIVLIFFLKHIKLATEAFKKQLTTRLATANCKHEWACFVCKETPPGPVAPGSPLKTWTAHMFSRNRPSHKWTWACLLKRTVSSQKEKVHHVTSFPSSFPSFPHQAGPFHKSPSRKLQISWRSQVAFFQVPGAS